MELPNSCKMILKCWGAHQKPTKYLHAEVKVYSLNQYMVINQSTTTDERKEKYDFFTSNTFSIQGAFW